MEDERSLSISKSCYSLRVATTDCRSDRIFPWHIVRQVHLSTDTGEMEGWETDSNNAGMKLDIQVSAYCPFGSSVVALSSARLVRR